MDWPYIRRCTLALVATLVAPFAGLAFGRALYFAMAEFSRFLGFSPYTPNMGAEAFFAAAAAVVVSLMAVIVVWAWATEGST